MMEFTLVNGENNALALKKVLLNEQQVKVLSTVVDFLTTYEYSELVIKKHNSIVNIVISNQVRIDTNGEKS